MKSRSSQLSECLAVCLIVVGALLLAWHLRFVQDDAFISFNYARALFRGDGLTWCGTRVEGYINFLWILWTALGLRLHIDPVDGSYLGGLFAFVLALYSTWQLSRSIIRSPTVRVIALAATATNYSVLAYATGGLETMPVAAMVCLCVWQVTSMWDGSTPIGYWRLIGLSLLLAITVLTRLDTAIPVVVLVLLTLGAMRRHRVGSVAHVQAILIPLATIVGGWFMARFDYYGDVLPNLYYAKGRTGSITNGLLYVARFAHSYGIWPLVLATGLVALKRSRWRSKPYPYGAWIPSAATLITWLAYVVSVGGDFMEFRLVVPVTPIAFVLLFAALDFALDDLRGGRFAELGALLLLLGASYHHSTSFVEISEDRTLDSIPALRTFYGLYPTGDWARIGDPLKRELGGHSITIATSACGAIPYYSDLRTVDMCGLNDRTVARNGIRAGSDYRRPGHQVAASRDYLRGAGTNLILGHPVLVPRGALSASGDTELWRFIVSQMAFFEPVVSGTVRLVAIPIDSSESLIAWYFVRADYIDEKLSSGSWEQKTLSY